MTLTLTKTERKRRAKRLALFNSYRALYDRTPKDVVAEGAGWYPSAHKACRILADTVNHPISRAAAVLAVLSPGTRWKDNIKSAYGALTGDWDTAFRWHAYGNQAVSKARTIVDNRLTGQDAYDILNTAASHKVPQFYRSIMLHSGSACIDSWIYRINRLDYLSDTPPKGHREASKTAIRMLSSYTGLPSYAMQAVLWLQKRKEAGQVGYADAVELTQALL